MNRIRELRLARNMSQAQLGAALGCVGQTISKLETEARQLDPSTIHVLCDYFGCTADYLLGRSDTRLPVVTDDDARLLAAYHAADPRDREFVDHLLRLDLQDAGKIIS